MYNVIAHDNLIRTTSTSQHEYINFIKRINFGIIDKQRRGGTACM